MSLCDPGARTAEPARTVAVILGGAGGIGSAIARRLAESRTTLVVGYVQGRERARSLAEELEGKAAGVHLFEGNVASPRTLDDLRRLVDSLGGRCDHLVHCVGLTSFKSIVRVRPNQWNLTFEVSARSFLDAVNALVDPLARARGTVVALSSQGSTRFVPEYGALGPAKAALESTVRYLACELAPRGIRVNAVRAGLIEGEIARGLDGAVREEVKRRTPLRRLGTADEVAAAVAFLLGPDAGWILGQVIEVDGGFSLP